MQRFNELNKIQFHIVKALFLRDGQRFAELNAKDVSNDHFSYHLRKLTKDGYIHKDDAGNYHLTTKGKTAALFLDTQDQKYISQGFVACRVVLCRDNNGVKEYLIQRRSKVPFKGYLAEPGGKILWGETVVESAQRNMFEQTGLECDMELKGQIHIHDLYDNNIVQDKFFFVLKARVVSGTLQDSGPTGTNHWMTEAEILQDPKVHKGVAEIHKIAAANDFSFCEVTHTTTDY